MGGGAGSSSRSLGLRAWSHRRGEPPAVKLRAWARGSAHGRTHGRAGEHGEGKRDPRGTVRGGVGVAGEGRDLSPEHRTWSPSAALPGR